MEPDPIAQLMRQQRFAEAASALQGAITLAPGDTNLRMQLAVVAFRAGDTVAARAQLESILQLEPGHALALFHLGYLEQRSGNATAAERLYRDAIQRQPDYVDALLNLAVLLRATARQAEAQQCLLTARAAAPRRADIAEMLARNCLDLALYDDAVQRADEAIELNPSSATGWVVMGLAWRGLGAYNAAKNKLTQAAALAPNNGEIAMELAMTSMEMGDFDGALAQFANARGLAPDRMDWRWQDLLAYCVFPASQAQAESATARFADGVEQLHAELANSNSPMWLPAIERVANVTAFHIHYRSIDTTAATRRFGELISRIVARAHPEYCRPLTPAPRRERVRVAFVCSAFREHTVVSYFSQWLLRLDRGRFEVHAWHVCGIVDAVTTKIASAVDSFHQVDSLGVSGIAESIRAHRFDVLVHLDVGMHGTMHVLAAMRLAAVQCVAYGHPVTTGLGSVDYFVSGAAMEPEDAETHYSERLVRLPGLGVIPLRSPPAGDASWAQREPGRPLLLCLQNIMKLSPEFDRIVARIAAATDARIVFLERTRFLSDLLRARLESTFAALGLDAGRHVAIERQQPYPDYIAGIEKADAVIDSTFFSGGRSSLDTLDVGTPVVTMEGRWMRGRQTAAMLRMVGAAELIAADADAYVATVASLCADRARRERLREVILANNWKLFDPPDVMDALERFLRDPEHFAGTSPQRRAHTV